MINFDNIPTNDFQALPESWYVVKAVKAELADSKNGPNTMIKVEFNVVSPAKYSKRKVWNNFNLGEKSLWVLKVFLESCGINVEDLGEVSEQKLLEIIPGTVSEAYLEPGVTTTGKPTNTVSNFRKVVGMADVATTSEPQSGTTSEEKMFS